MNRCELCGYAGEPERVARSLAIGKVVCLRCYQRHSGAPILTNDDVAKPAGDEAPRFLNRSLTALKSLGLPVVANGLPGAAAAVASKCPNCRRADLRITWTARDLTLTCLGEPSCREADIAHHLGAAA